jgi:hypothetical protein
MVEVVVVDDVEVVEVVGVADVDVGAATVVVVEGAAAVLGVSVEGAASLPPQAVTTTSRATKDGNNGCLPRPADLTVTVLTVCRTIPLL